uniref:Uncharacterized protein n=1 Tax=Arundo donax TaxID=35708 RepID=A0A0A9CF74_ARUDO
MGERAWGLIPDVAPPSDDFDSCRSSVERQLPGSTRGMMSLRG